MIVLVLPWPHHHNELHHIYIITAAPRKVDFGDHGLHQSSENSKSRRINSYSGSGTKYWPKGCSQKFQQAWKLCIAAKSRYSEVCYRCQLFVFVFPDYNIFIMRNTCQRYFRVHLIAAINKLFYKQSKKIRRNANKVF